MNRQPYIVAIMLFAMINGIFSPWLGAILPFVFVLMPAFFTDSISILLFSSSLLFSTLTLIVGGIPAALYERYIGASESTELSMWLWLAGTGLLTLPAAANFLSIGL